MALLRGEKAGLLDEVDVQSDKLETESHITSEDYQ